jgi:hypothetical protein
MTSGCSMKAMKDVRRVLHVLRSRWQTLRDGQHRYSRIGGSVFLLDFAPAAPPRAPIAAILCSTWFAQGVHRTLRDLVGTTWASIWSVGPSSPGTA